MEEKFLPILIFLTLFFLGYGLTAVLIPQRLKNWGIWLSPWSGTILILFITVSSSFGDLSLMKSVYAVILTSLLLAFYALISKKSFPLFSKFNLLILVLLYFTILLQINNTHTSNIKETVKKTEYFVKASMVKDISTSKRLFYKNFNIGSSMILGFFLVLYKIKNTDLFAVLPLVYFFLSLPLFLIFLENRKKTFFLTGFLYLLYLFIIKIYKDKINLDFIIYGGITLMTVSLLILYFFEVFKKKDIIMNLTNYDFFIALNLYSLTVILPELLKFTLLSIIVITFFIFLVSKKINIILALGKILLLFLIVNPVTAGMSLKIR